MAILGIILAIAGVASTIYGFAQNDSLEAQMSSLINNGSTNPGTMFIVIGGVAILIGVILLAVGLRKQKPQA